MEPERADAVTLVQTLVCLEERVRRRGFLSLEGVEAIVPDAKLRAGIEMVVDLAPPEVIQHLGEGWIAAAEAEHAAYLRRLRLILAGTLELQRGTEPRLLREMLAAFLPATPAGGAPGDLVALVDTFLRLVHKAVREGLLSLEEELPQLGDALLATGIQLVVDGTPPEEIVQILEAQIDTARLEHLLERKRLRLLQEGLVALSQGFSPRTIYEHLSGHLLADDRARLPALPDLPRPAWALPEPPGAPEPPEPEADPAAAGTPAEALLLRLRSHDVWRVTKELRFEDLAAAFAGGAEPIQHRLRVGLSSRNWVRLQQLMAAPPVPGDPDRAARRVEWARSRFVDVVKLLASQEEITLPKGAGG